MKLRIERNMNDEENLVTAPTREETLAIRLSKFYEKSDPYDYKDYYEGQSRNATDDTEKLLVEDPYYFIELLLDYIEEKEY